MNVSKIRSPHFDTAVKYAKKIASGKVLANQERILACQRFLDDLKRRDLDFRQDQFDFVIDLIEGTVHHVRGEDGEGRSLKGVPMRLTEWQKL